MSNPISDSHMKKVDESWKEQVERERVLQNQRRQPSPSESTLKAQEPPGGDFAFFLSSLFMQAMMALGELPNPVTQTQTEDLENARSLIDILGLLQEKTKGNLSPEEGKLLEECLYELRMKYVSKKQPRPSAKAGGAAP